MIDPDGLALLRCPSCEDGALREATRALICDACEHAYPVVDGIPDLVPPERGEEAQLYRTETLLNRIAGVYDLAVPAMSTLLWGCEPLRFVDWAHMAAGRARGGALLSVPIDTGRLLTHIWGPHLGDVMVVGADLSWQMLRRARKKLARAGVKRALLVRALPSRLPLRSGGFRAVLSINGLHTVPQRELALREMARVIEPGGMLAGSTLIRGQRRMADRALDAYDRRGVSPMPRSKAYVLSELAALGGGKQLSETYGAVLFFAVEPQAALGASPAPSADDRLSAAGLSAESAGG